MYELVATKGRALSCDLPRKNVRNVQGFKLGSSSTLMTRVTRSSAVVTATLALLAYSSPSYAGKSLSLPLADPTSTPFSIIWGFAVSWVWNSLGKRASILLLRRLESPTLPTVSCREMSVSAPAKLGLLVDIVAVKRKDARDTTKEEGRRASTKAQSYV